MQVQRINTAMPVYRNQNSNNNRQQSFSAKLLCPPVEDLQHKTIRQIISYLSKLVQEFKDERSISVRVQSGNASNPTRVNVRSVSEGVDTSAFAACNKEEKMDSPVIKPETDFNPPLREILERVIEPQKYIEKLLENKGITIETAGEVQSNPDFERLINVSNFSDFIKDLPESEKKISIKQGVDISNNPCLNFYQDGSLLAEINRDTCFYHLRSIMNGNEASALPVDVFKDFIENGRILRILPEASK